MIQKHDHVYLELLNEIITLFVNENEWIAVVRYSFVYFFPPFIVYDFDKRRNMVLNKSDYLVILQHCI